MTGHRMESALTESRRAKEDAEELAAALLRARAEWEETLRERFKSRPYATIATAVGVGYVLGGGLVPGLLRPLATVGGRVALSLFLQRVFAAPGADQSTNNALTEG